MVVALKRKARMSDDVQRVVGNGLHGPNLLPGDRPPAQEALLKKAKAKRRKRPT